MQMKFTNLVMKADFQDCGEFAKKIVVVFVVSTSSKFKFPNQLKFSQLNVILLIFTTEIWANVILCSELGNGINPNGGIGQNGDAKFLLQSDSLFPLKIFSNDVFPQGPCNIKEIEELDFIKLLRFSSKL